MRHEWSVPDDKSAPLLFVEGESTNASAESLRREVQRLAIDLAVRDTSLSVAREAALQRADTIRNLEDERDRLSKEVWRLTLDRDLFYAMSKNLRSSQDLLESTLAMTVSRLGGEVEGAPTARVNFLQRVDALREIEAERDRLAKEVERLKAEASRERERERANSTRIATDNTLTRVGADTRRAVSLDRVRIREELLEDLRDMEREQAGIEASDVFEMINRIVAEERARIREELPAKAGVAKTAESWRSYHNWKRTNQDPHHPHLRCRACHATGYEPMPAAGCPGGGGWTLSPEAMLLLRSQINALRGSGTEIGESDLMAVFYAERQKERAELRPLLERCSDMILGLTEADGYEELLAALRTELGKETL